MILHLLEIWVLFCMYWVNALTPLIELAEKANNIVNSAQKVLHVKGVNATEILSKTVETIELIQHTTRQIEQYSSSFVIVGGILIFLLCSTFLLTAYNTFALGNIKRRLKEHRL